MECVFHPQSQLLKDLSASTKAENGNVRTEWKLKAFPPSPDEAQPRPANAYLKFSIPFPSQTSHVLSIFNFSWLSFPFFSISICRCDKRDSKFNVLVGKAWTGRWFHFRIVAYINQNFSLRKFILFNFDLWKAFFSRNRWEWSMWCRGWWTNAELLSLTFESFLYLGLKLCEALNQFQAVLFS